MPEKIQTKEIMTTRAAIMKYRTKFFAMVITEIVDYADNDLGYVVYTADSEDGLCEISRAAYPEQKVGIFAGYCAEPFPMIGNVVYHD